MDWETLSVLRRLAQLCQVDTELKKLKLSRNDIFYTLKIGLMTPDFSEVCANVGKAIDIEGGCHAYLAKDDHEFSQVYQPGFNTLIGVFEHNATIGIDTAILDNFNKAKLFCKIG